MGNMGLWVQCVEYECEYKYEYEHKYECENECDNRMLNMNMKYIWVLILF